MKTKDKRSTMMKAFVMAMLLTSVVVSAQNVDVNATAEIGVVRPLSHDIRIGLGTYSFDYVREGGQELLLPYNRFEVETVISGRHEVDFLYQPLTLNTKTRVDNAGGIQIDDVTFGNDTPLDLKYGFDFYRGTYRYRFVNTEQWQFSAGAALQIRNASIIFDGYDAAGNDVRVITQDLGPVPVISLALRGELGGGLFLEGSADGFYAPIKYLNLSDVEVVGWLYDGSLKVGVEVMPRTEAYLSVRFLGGGADGESSAQTLWTKSRERDTYNNLNLAVLSLGVRFH